MKIIGILLAFLCFSVSVAAQVNKKSLTITQLAGDFYVFVTWQNLAGSPFPSNGMYLITDAGAVIFDCPWDSTQLQPLLDSIQIKHHKKAVLDIATHSHDDRTAGLAFFREKLIKTYTSRQTDSICKARNKNRAAFVFDKDTSFTVGQYSFQTYYAGPGHTTDNIVIWFQKEKILYGGCLIKSSEATDLGNMADANLQEWSKTIKKIQTKFGLPAYIIPGHQDWSSNKSLEHTLELLSQNTKTK